MFLKYHYDLQPQDLLRLESPFFAAEKIRELFRRGTPIPASLFFHYSPPITHSRPDLHYKELVSKIEAGELCLVYSDIESGSVSAPLVAWRPGSEAEESGLWNCAGTFGRGIPGLEELVAEMNRRRITPQTLQKMSATGASSLNEIEQWNQFAESVGGDQPRQDEHRLSLPIGGSANIAPLPMREQHNSTSPERGVHLVMGLFTDGTLNNIDNIELFREQVRECEVLEQTDPEAAKACADRLALELGDSYANAPTNVVKLFDLYREGETQDGEMTSLMMKTYSHGVGTENGGEDSTLDSATGLGKTGVVSQVNRLFDSTAAIANLRLRGRPVTKLSIDLFGFSRGAAAARHAANSILRGRAGKFGRALSKQGIGWPEQVEVRFLGLFDTVAGIVNLRAGDFSASDGENDPVELKLDSSKIGKVVHFVARDEIRANFALNSVGDSDGRLPENFREISLPGAHSDVGGGYHSLQDEELLLAPVMEIRGSDTQRPEQTMKWDNLEALMVEIQSEGWIGDYSLPMRDGTAPTLEITQKRSEHPAPDGRVDLALKMRRRVSGEYSNLCLNLMYEMAKEAGLLFDAIPDEDSWSYPEELAAICDSLKSQIVNGVDAPQLVPKQRMLLKQRYTHCSSHYNPIRFMLGEQEVSMEFPFQPWGHPLRPTPTRKRTVHYQQGIGKA